MSANECATLTPLSAQYLRYTIPTLSHYMPKSILTHDQIGYSNDTSVNTLIASSLNVSCVTAVVPVSRPSPIPSPSANVMRLGCSVVYAGHAGTVGPLGSSAVTKLTR